MAVRVPPDRVESGTDDRLSPAQSPHRHAPSLQVSREQTDAWLRASGFGLVEEILGSTTHWSAVDRR
jgi:hypothetical protein